MHLHYFINVILHSFSSLSIPFLQQYLNHTIIHVTGNLIGPITVAMETARFLWMHQCARFSSSHYTRLSRLFPFPKSKIRTYTCTIYVALSLSELSLWFFGTSFITKKSWWHNILVNCQTSHIGLFGSAISGQFSLQN